MRLVGAQIASVAALLVSALASLPASAQQAAAPYTHAMRFNPAGQVTGTIAPDPDGASGILAYRAVRNTYGTSGLTRGLLVMVEAGELTSWANETVDPSSWEGYGFAVYLKTIYTYDSYGRRNSERIVGSDGATESLTQFSYDDWDRVRCKAVRMNKQAFASPPSDACVLGTQGSEGPDRITRFTYDGLGMVLTEERAVGTSLQQVYTRNEWSGRKLTSQKDANGNRTDYRYNSDWRLHRRVYPSKTATGYVDEGDYNQYGYDGNGNVTYERKRNGHSISYSIDGNNRVTFKNLSDNSYSDDVTYNYDLRGLTLSSCFGATDSCKTAGAGESNDFNGFGDLTRRTSRMAGVSRELNFTFDSEGSRTRITHPDGNSFSYRFDGLNRMCSVTEGTTAIACDGSGEMLKITYRPSGHRLDLLRPNGHHTNLDLDNALRLEGFTQNFTGVANDLSNLFLYNPANQIVKLTQSNANYTYNELGSRTGTYGVNGQNQITSIGSNNFSYDANGNLVADGAGMTFSYDMENRLVATSGTASSTLVYDALGRLAQVSIGGTATQFHYDGDALVGEYTGGVLTRFVHGDQVDEPLVQYNGSLVGASYRRYLHADHQGSIIAHSDNAGNLLSSNAYDAYGIPKGANDGRFGFTGQTWLKPLGLNYYKARMYSPKLGRFLQTDPIFYQDDMNIYAYVGNDPVNRIDPKGTADADTPYSVRQVIIETGPYSGVWTVVTAKTGYHVEAPQDRQTNGTDDAAKAHNFEVSEADENEHGEEINGANTISIEALGQVFDGDVATHSAVAALDTPGVLPASGEAGPSDTASPASDTSPDSTQQSEGGSKSSGPIDLPIQMPEPEIEEIDVKMEPPSF